MDQLANEQGRSVARLPKGAGATLGIFLATAILFILGGVIVPQSISPGAIYGMLPFAAILVIISLGQTLVVQQAGIDLSAPGFVSLSAVFVCHTYANGPIAIQSVLALTFIAVVLAAVAGACSGLLITKLALRQS